MEVSDILKMSIRVMNSIYIENLIKQQDINKQINEHSLQIDDFNALICHERTDDIKRDITVLEQGNKIFFDKNRKFSKYDFDSIMLRARQRIESVKKQINGGNIDSYCDIGCGRGENLTAAVEMGAKRAVGIDIEPDWQTVDWNIDSKIEFKQMDISKEPYNEKFDLVTSYWAFEHFENPYKMLEKMAALVNKGGYLYIRFGPLWNSNDGHHLYRHIQFPYYHLIFDEDIKIEYFNKLKLNNKTWCNRWTAYDFMMMLLNFTKLKMVDFHTYYNTSALWFIKSFPNLLCEYSLEELLTEGFKVIYKNE